MDQTILDRISAGSPVPDGDHPAPENPLTIGLDGRTADGSVPYEILKQ